jgi:DNA-directed RNA polymerase specialized sigma24 family protein
MSQFAGIEVTAEMLSAACSGDTRAQEAIYRSYQRTGLFADPALIARPAIADELFQDTFIEILRSLQQLLRRWRLRRLGASDRGQQVPHVSALAVATQLRVSRRRRE